MNEQQLIDIKTLIDWYKDNHNNCTLDKLMSNRDTLVCLNYELTELLTEFNSKYLVKDEYSQVQINRTMKSLIKEFGATEARSRAKDRYSNDLLLAANYKSTFDRLDRLLKASNNVVTAMNQRISVVRIDDEMIKRSTNGH